MKRINTFLTILFISLLSSPSWSETIDDLVERNGIYYKKFTDVPFTGAETTVAQYVAIVNAAGIAGVTAAGIAANELKKARPIKAMQNAAKWIKKGVKNKIQTGNRKGITKKKK